MMTGSAGFHTHQATRKLAKEVEDLLAPQLAGDARTIHAVNLEHVLGEINADGVNMDVDDPSGDSLFNDHPFGTFDAGSGVVHHINRVASSRPSFKSSTKLD